MRSISSLDVCVAGLLLARSMHCRSPLCWRGRRVRLLSTREEARVERKVRIDREGKGAAGEVV